jgi:hypothetical protein
MNKIKVGWLLSLAIAVVGCTSKTEKNSGTSEYLKRVGDIAKAEVSLPIDGSLLWMDYLRKETATVELENETKPGRIAVLTEELRSATKKWKEGDQALQDGLKTLRGLCVEEPTWTEKEKAVFRSYSGKALGTCNAVEIKYRENLRAVDAFISVYRHGTPEEIGEARDRLFKER